MHVGAGHSPCFFPFGFGFLKSCVLDVVGASAHTLQSVGPPSRDTVRVLGFFFFFWPDLILFSVHSLLEGTGDCRC